ncbi:hypothetical protein NUM3379_05870 [Kineococcus sp. NUM-3379]
MPPGPDLAALRRCLLGVVVLDDLDLELGEDGVGVPVAGGDPLVPWPEVAAAVGSPSGSAGAPARLRVRDWLLAHRGLQEEAAAGTDPWNLLLPLALPVGSAAHLGAAWASTRVLGGALDLGLGVRVPSAEPPEARVVPLPRPVAARLGLDVLPGGAQPQGVLSYLERMGGYAASRLRRDEGVRGGDVLRPVGGCDVPTLLASSALRDFLAGGAQGLRAVAVPMRDRGWFDLARIDPAFVGAAWSATEVERRGFPRALLVTRDEVAMPEPHVDLDRRSLRV